MKSNVYRGRSDDHLGRGKLQIPGGNHATLDDVAGLLRTIDWDNEYPGVTNPFSSVSNDSFSIKVKRVLNHGETRSPKLTTITIKKQPTYFQLYRDDLIGTQYKNEYGRTVTNDSGYWKDLSDPDEVVETVVNACLSKADYDLLLKRRQLKRQQEWEESRQIAAAEEERLAALRDRGREIRHSRDT
jgi:hypothetical protein